MCCIQLKRMCKDLTPALFEVQNAAVAACLFASALPTHINIAQALSSPLSHISDVVKCHDSPLFNTLCMQDWIVAVLNNAVIVPAV